MKPFLLSKGTLFKAPIYIVSEPIKEDYDILTMSYEKVKNPSELASMHLGYSNVIVTTYSDVYKVCFGKRLTNVVNLYIHTGEINEDTFISKIDDKPLYIPCKTYNVPPTLLDFPKYSITFISKGAIKSTQSNCLGIDQAKKEYELDPFFNNILYFLSDAIKTLIVHNGC